jgi:hypothetical protein
VIADRKAERFVTGGHTVGFDAAHWIPGPLMQDGLIISADRALPR